MADAEASLSTSIETMSCGLICFKSPASPQGNPSMTTSGAFEPLSDELPRMRTVDEAPGSCEELTTCTPATRPCNSPSIELAGMSVSFSALTEATEPVRSLFLTCP